MTSYQDKPNLKVALPKGGLMADVSNLISDVGFIVPGYDLTSRVYRLYSKKPAGVFVKVFSEKDIPIQVAVGNYDIGISGSDWTDELTSKYRKIAIVKVMGLGFGSKSLFVASSPKSDIESIKAKVKGSFVRVASEYPNLSEAFCRESKFAKYKIFPVWGGAEAYIPDSAEICVIKAEGTDEIRSLGLEPISMIKKTEATVIANRESFEKKDLSSILNLFEKVS